MVSRSGETKGQTVVITTFVLLIKQMHFMCCENYRSETCDLNHDDQVLTAICVNAVIRTHGTSSFTTSQTGFFSNWPTYRDVATSSRRMGYNERKYFSWREKRSLTVAGAESSRRAGKCLNVARWGLPVDCFFMQTCDIAKARELASAPYLQDCICILLYDGLTFNNKLLSLLASRVHAPSSRSLKHHSL